MPFPDEFVLLITPSSLSLIGFKLYFFDLFFLVKKLDIFIPKVNFFVLDGDAWVFAGATDFAVFAGATDFAVFAGGDSSDGSFLKVNHDDFFLLEAAAVDIYIYKIDYKYITNAYV